MLPEVTLLIFIGLVLMLGGREWRRKSTKYVVIAVIAFLQTVLVVFEMFIMKVPKI